MSGQLASIPFERGGAGTHAISNVPHFPRFSPSLSYASLTMPGDPFEREADRLSGEAMRGEPTSLPRSFASPLQPNKGSGSNQLDVPASVHRALAGPGCPLSAGLTREMSQRFGHDFSQVRVHDGAVADESARHIQAIAYTVGPNIVFGAGRLAPETGEGRRLIAHELAHVVQQSRPGSEPRIYRAAPTVPAPLDMTSEAEVGYAFDRLADYAGVEVAKEVWIVVNDSAGNPVTGRVDRIVKLPDGTYKGVELKLDATSARTAAQEIYIKLANEGRVVEITGYAADGIDLPQGTRMELPIQIISSENVADTVAELGLKPKFVSRVIQRPAGTETAARGPSEFETAAESAEQAPRSPRAIRTPSGAPSTTGESAGGTPVVRPRRLAYEAPPEAEAAPGMTGAAGTALSIATPVVGVVDELLVGDDMARIRHILGKGFAPNTEEKAFMESWGLVWQESDFSYSFQSFSWWIYWVGKTFLNPWVLCPQGAPGCLDQGNQPMGGQEA